MTESIWFHYISLFLSLFLTVAVGLYAWRHRNMPGIKYFAFLMLAEASWVAGFLLELISPRLESKIFWDDFQFIGSMFVPVLLLIFAFEYTGQQRLLSRQVRIGLITFPVLFLIFLFSNPYLTYFTATNPAALSTLGLPAERVIGLPISTFFEDQSASEQKNSSRLM